MSKVITTQELAKYLKFHEITIIKHAEEGTIPGFRVGRSWRFDKEIIDKWINDSQKKLQIVKKTKVKATKMKSLEKTPVKKASVQKRTVKKKPKKKTVGRK